MFKCGKSVIKCSDIPSAVELTKIYEKNFEIESKKRMENLKRCLICELNDAANDGNNYCIFWEDSVPCTIATYKELSYLRKELKQLGFKVRLKMNDSWTVKWYLSISWGKDIDLRDIL